MARRRLSPVLPGTPGGGGEVARAEQAAPPTPEGAAGLPPSLSPSLSPPRAGVPIARVAAEAAGQAALAEVVETLRRAEAEGRMVLEIPLGEIAADHIARDRIAPDAFDTEGEMAALVESLRAHGQRTPIEVTRLRDPASGPGTDGGFALGRLPYGLISGWRRLSALQALHAETGEARFATAKALVRRPASAAEAYVAMVEENEIRLGLSQYERARVAALAVERGVFPDEGEALRALFAGASRAKRSRLRAFIEIYRALDGVLRFPAHLPERLGLRIAERLRAGEGAALSAALGAGAGTAASEIAALEAALERLDARDRSRAEAEAREAEKRAAEAREAEAREAGAPGDRDGEGREAGTEREDARREDGGREAIGRKEAGRDAGAEREAPEPETPEPEALEREGAGWRWERLGAGLELGIREGARPELRLRGPAVTPALTARLRAALGA